MKSLAAGAAAMTLTGSLLAGVALWSQRSSALAGTSSITGSATATATAVRAKPPGAGSPVIGGCPVFPADNPWNTRVDTAPRHPNSDAIMATIRSNGNQWAHANFGEFPGYGIPYIVVPENQPLVNVRYTQYPQESDPGPFPMPDNAPIEGNSDRHVIVLQQGTCKLHEFFLVGRDANGWHASNGATWDLRSNALRPDRWTSGDAAGLAMLPGLARCEEVEAGSINHALRMTMEWTAPGFIHPATHSGPAGPAVPNKPVMGMRVRMKADYDLSRITGQARIVAQALKTYGALVADVGANFYVGGSWGPCWDDVDLHQLDSIPGSAFEIVDTGPVRL